MSFAKTAEPIEMQFGMLIRWIQGTMDYMGMHIDAIWRMRLNRPRAASMRPCVKLLLPLVWWQQKPVWVVVSASNLAESFID